MFEDTTFSPDLALAALSRSFDLLHQHGLELAVVVGATLVAGLVDLLLSIGAGRWRGRLSGELVGDVRLPVIATIGLSGLLWVSLDPRQSVLPALVVVLVACCWALGVVRAVTHLGGRLFDPGFAAEQRPAHSSGPGPGSSSGGHAVEWDHFNQRAQQEISRVARGGSGRLNVVAIGVKVDHRPLLEPWQRRIWQLLQRSTLPHDVLHHADDGSVLALLPDASPGEVRRWLSVFQEPGAEAAIGLAGYPVDGVTVAQLLDCAVSRMWLDQGVVRCEGQAQAAAPSR